MWKVALLRAVRVRWLVVGTVVAAGVDRDEVAAAAVVVVAVVDHVAPVAVVAEAAVVAAAEVTAVAEAAVAHMAVAAVAGVTVVECHAKATRRAEATRFCTFGDRSLDAFVFA
jgi:hypothetical protein